MDHRLGQLDALLHTGRECFDISVSRFAQAGVLKDFVGSPQGLVGWHSGEFSCIGNKADGGKAGNVAILFRHQTHSLADLASVGVEVEAEDVSAATSGFDESEDRFEKRCFAGPVGAKQPGATRFDFAGEVIQRDKRTVSNG